LPNRLRLGIVFPKGRHGRLTFLMGDARPGFGVQEGNDSEMAPQAIEIA
jgi:hypothetical protein